MGKRLRAGSLAFGLVVGAGQLALIGGAAPAHAASITKSVVFDCHVFSVNGNGTIGGEITPNPPPTFTQSFTLNGPTEVNAHTAFDAVSPSASTAVPASVMFAGNPVNLDEVKNIVLGMQITGASTIGTPTFSGGNVLGESASVNGSTVSISLPGNTDTPASLIPTPGTHHFTPGTNFSQPQITTNVTAGNAGTQIIATAKSFQSDVRALGLNTRAICDPQSGQDLTLAVVNVVTPPPPGAPNAVADTTSTNQGKSVTVDVLKNDVKNADFDIDLSSLAVTANPKHGTATVNADHTITYDPAAGFHGIDSFDYKLCSVPDQENQQPGGCDTATVTITVVAPQTPTTTTPTTKKTTVTTSGSTQTTAAAAQLPRTGGASGMLAVMGFGLCMLGGAAMYATRRWRRRFEI